MIKSNSDRKALNIFNYNYLYIAYTGDITFILNDQNQLVELLS